MKKVLLAIAIAALMAAPAMAADPYQLAAGGGLNSKQYHSYDGLVCTDCHTLHASDLNRDTTADPSFVQGTLEAGRLTLDGYAGSPYRELLKRGDWTDMCLSCHRENNNTSATAALPGVLASGWTAPIVMTANGTIPSNISMPGGDFYWSAATTATQNPRKGHNPAYTRGTPAGTTTGTSKFIIADPTLKSVPPGNGGADILAAGDKEWSCHSCHGMHARFSDSYSAWRQLKRKVNGICIDRTDDGNAVDHVLGDCGKDAAGAPIAQNTSYEPIKSNSRGDILANLDYVNKRGDDNVLEGANLFAAYSDTNKNVYRGGFSSFCATCHGDFHGGTGETRGTVNGKTNVNSTWVRHPTNVKMNETAVVMANSTKSSGSGYGITTYSKAMSNKQGYNPNPPGYDFRYPLIQPDTDFTVKSTVASAGTAATALGDSRISCLTCHKAHATQYENMTRWDAKAHSFLPANSTADVDGQSWDNTTGGGSFVTTSVGDNPAFGCGKCHQKGGTKAFVLSFN